jgi:hypothetical protein
VSSIRKLAQFNCGMRIAEFKAESSGHVDHNHHP